MTSLVSLEFLIHKLYLNRRNLERFEMSHNSAMNAVDPDSGNGEVTIRLPPDCFQIIAGNITARNKDLE